MIVMASFTATRLMPMAINFKNGIGAIVIFGILYLVVKEIRKKIRKKRKPKNNSVSENIENIWHTELKRLQDSPKGGTKILDSLPCYMIMGKSDCGKSSLMLQSQMPVYNKNEPEKKKVITTKKEIELWKFEKMIILDCAGDIVTRGGDDWELLVKLLSDAKSEDVLDGVIIVKEAKDLFDSNEHTLKQDAVYLKNRIEDLSKRCKENIPVYVVINKLDELASFRKMFEVIPEEIAGLMGGEIASKSWKDGFGKLTAELNNRLIKLRTRLFFDHREKISDLLELIKDFSSINTKLDTFLTQLVGGNTCHEQSQLHGLYYAGSGNKSGRDTHAGIFVKDIFKTLQKDLKPRQEKIKLVTRNNIIASAILFLLIFFSLFTLIRVKKIGNSYRKYIEATSMEVTYNEAVKLEKLLNNLPMMIFVPRTKIKNKIQENYDTQFWKHVSKTHNKTKPVYYLTYNRFPGYPQEIDSIIDDSWKKYIKYYIKFDAVDIKLCEMIEDINETELRELIENIKWKHDYYDMHEDWNEKKKILQENIKNSGI